MNTKRRFKNKKLRESGIKAMRSLLTLFKESALFNCLATIALYAITAVWAFTGLTFRHIKIKVTHLGVPFEISWPSTDIRFIRGLYLFLRLSFPALILICLCYVLGKIRTVGYKESTISNFILWLFLIVKILLFPSMHYGLLALILPLLILISDMYKDTVLPRRSAFRDSFFVSLAGFLLKMEVFLGLIVYLRGKQSCTMAKFLETEGMEVFKERITSFCWNNLLSMDNIILFQSTIWDTIMPASLFRFIFKTQSYIIISTEWLKSLDPDAVIAVLKQNLAHRDNADYLMCRVFLMSVFPSILFVTIINRSTSKMVLRTLKPESALLLLSNLSLALAIFEMGACLCSNFLEYRADRNATDMPVLATGLAKALAMSLSIGHRSIYELAGIVGRDYSPFEIYPPLVNRILRICERYPDLFSIRFDE